MEYNSGSFLSVSSKADQFTSKISSPSNKDLYFSLMEGLLNKNGGPPFWHILQRRRLCHRGLVSMFQFVSKQVVLEHQMVVFLHFIVVEFLGGDHK